jgi:two-component system sensor histidine kinase HydH
VLTKGEWLYIDIRHSDYWRERTLMDILFPLAEALIIALAFSMRYLALKNADYRERIERQKNLVVLGTAAITLAHEIKNPLLAIASRPASSRSCIPNPAPRNSDHQCGNRAAFLPDVPDQRLSSRAEGRSRRFRRVRLVRDCAKSLCGRDPVTSDDAGRASVRMDPDRFRSAFGNLVRNALESGGDPALVEVAISREDRFIVVDVLDRGTASRPGPRAICSSRSSRRRARVPASACDHPPFHRGGERNGGTRFPRRRRRARADPSSRDWR